MKAILLAMVLSGILAGGVRGLAASSDPAAETEMDLAATGIAWQSWSPDAFKMAQREHKLVLLHLGAGWCHWCHVMEHVTYRDPAVDQLIQEHFVAIHVDQDSRPDLSNRYEDYGWPATILFDAAGHELVKWQGYITPGRMRSLLEATIADPTPGPSVTGVAAVTYGDQTALDSLLKLELSQNLIVRYDKKEGGWGTVHKLLNWDAIEYEMLRGRTGDAAAAERAKASLAGARQLIDPVWGGLYQYSTDGDWVHPHFEKIMQYQAEGMRIYSLAYSAWHDPADLKAATDIHRFLIAFLAAPDGAFYTSQDADVVPGEHSGEYFSLDDARRRKIGIPRVDRHLYARENAWAVRGLVALYNATGESRYLGEAQKGEAWITSHRAIPGGGFHHDEQDSAGPYLGDTLAVAQAELALYQSTMVRDYLAKAEGAASFIETHFSAKGGAGYLTAEPNDLIPPLLQFDENVAIVRFANLLYHYSGKDDYHQMATQAMRYVATPAIAETHEPAATLLADNELSHDPVHITVVGSMDDSAGKTLYATALAAGIPYLRVEWYDPHGAAPVRDDVQYPSMKYAAAYLCTGNACSAPVKTSDELKRLIERRALPAK